MLIFCPQESDRFTYILNELLTRRMGLQYTITDNETYFIKSAAIKLNYSNQVFPNCVNIPLHGLLFEHDIVKHDIQVAAHVKWLKIFFQLTLEPPVGIHEKYTLLPFDLFSGAFYLLSRYEELLPQRSIDMHGRYASENSLAVQHDFIKLPLVDCWIQVLKTLILEYFPTQQIHTNRTKFINTIDIDFLYKFRALPFSTKVKKTLGLVARNQIRQLKKLWFPVGADPYDTFDQLVLPGTETLFFVLMANGSKFDQNSHLDSLELQTLLMHLNLSNPIGIHPSLKSHRFPKQTQIEISKLKAIIQKDVCMSRQHFLKFKWPDTFRRLTDAGIQEDYSMAYPDVLGFRASTAIPFRVFDIKNNCELPIVIHSPCVMDVTLKNQLKLKPNEAVLAITDLKNAVKQVGGEMIGIWHNSSFDKDQGWAGWELVFQSMYSN